MGSRAIVGSIQVLLLAAGIAAASPGGASADARGGGLLIVVPARSRARDVSLGTLRRIFRGEIVETPDGERFRPFNLPPQDPTRVRFDRLVLAMSGAEVARYWIDRQIRGLGTSPRAISSPALLCRIVERIPGAIAYVPAPCSTQGTRVLRIGGKAPGEDGYPLAE
jgi:hypothetical protein